MTGRWIGTQRLLTATALLVALLTFAPPAESRSTANPSLDVTFNTNGTISVMLADGTPVGSVGGSPTVIPAGYYTAQLSAPGECFQVPLFELSGPGEDLQSDMDGGELNTEVYYIELRPNSTYSWTSSGTPGVVYTFATSATVVGSPVADSSGDSSSGDSAAPPVAHTALSSDNIVGSALTASGHRPATAVYRGRLAGTVSAAGNVTLAFRRRRVVSLRAGRYTLAVADRSSSGGFVLEGVRKAPVRVTGAPFVGKRTRSVELTAGRWFFSADLPGKRTYFTVAKG